MSDRLLDSAAALCLLGLALLIAYRLPVILSAEACWASC